MKSKELIEIDLKKLDQNQRNKILKVLRKHCPFRAIKWIEEE